MFDARFAAIYDIVYEGRGKDYTVEAIELTNLIRSARPDARSLLDVGCGTGLHLTVLTGEFEHVAGVELSEDMLAVARGRLPGVELHQGNMLDFDLDTTFDAVTCLFAAIGHMADVGELRAAVANLARHLSPGGVLVIEPWWFPEDFLPGYVAGDVVQHGELTIARVSHTVRDGDTTRMDAHYLVADPETGVRAFNGTIVNTLFTREEYLAAMTAAGCTATFVEHGPSARGRFVGVLA